MIRVHETTRTIPFYRPIPLTNLPLLYQRDHYFPYTSYGDTAETPVPRELRMVVLENAALRIEVAPELGGRVYSLFDKRIGKEILFSNPVVKPVRIPPISGFISGGIEFNFPCVHTPTAIAPVGCVTGQTDRYGFIQVGEREARTGMEWAVELGLVADEPVLVQRTALRNTDHPWTWWTIAAVPSTAGTEFIHPTGATWEREYREMQALFWPPGQPAAFGSFHHDLGFGLMHVADPRQVPGQKVWTFGHGRHRVWSEATTENGLAYAELESSPALDGALPGRFAEFWVPVHSRGECDQVKLPTFALPVLENPWLGYRHSAWQMEWERFTAGAGPLPVSLVPTCLNLEPALRRAGAGEPLALWLAFHGRPAEALALVRTNANPTAQWIAGLVQWFGLENPAGAIQHLEAGPLQDPVAVAKLDELYELLGRTGKRQPLLAKAPAHRLIIERRANLAIASGNTDEAIRLLSSTAWPRELGRQVRSTLWKRARPGEVIPEFLGEAEC